MADFVMLMMGSESHGDWDAYIQRLIDSGTFRGGSSLGHGVSVSRGEQETTSSITGYMRFSAGSIDEVKALVDGNPLYEAGGRIEILEEIPD